MLAVQLDSSTVSHDTIAFSRRSRHELHPPTRQQAAHMGAPYWVPPLEKTSMPDSTCTTDPSMCRTSGTCNQPWHMQNKLCQAPATEQTYPGKPLLPATRQPYTSHHQHNPISLRKGATAAPFKHRIDASQDQSERHTGRCALSMCTILM
jgi:hypothetical protein